MHQWPSTRFIAKKIDKCLWSKKGLHIKMKSLGWCHTVILSLPPCTLGPQNEKFRSKHQRKWLQDYESGWKPWPKMIETTFGEQDVSVRDLTFHYQTLVPFFKTIWSFFASCLSFSWLCFWWKLSNVSLPKDPFCEHDLKFHWQICDFLIQNFVLNLPEVSLPSPPAVAFSEQQVLLWKGLTCH